jgi:translation initiation factor 1
MNPFDLDTDFDSGLGRLTKPKLHIRIQKRNGKKCITTVEGFEEDLDIKRICKHMRKKFNCNGNVVSDEEQGEVIQLQGDQRDNVKQWLLENQVFEKQEADRIVVHGY